MCGASLFLSDPLDLFLPATSPPLNTHHLESGLLAGEATTTAATTEATTATTAATATTTAAEAATATATATTATTTEATAATATATTAATVGVTGLGIIKTDGSAIDVTTVEGLKGLLGILDRVEGHIGEALGATRLPSTMLVFANIRRVVVIGYSHISRDTEALDLAGLVEELRDALLAGTEGKVTDEEGVGFGADDIAVLAGAVLSALLGGIAGLRSEVETHVTALKESTGLGIEGLLADLGGVEVDIAEAARATSLLVRDDAGGDDTLELLELLIEDVVINAPAEVANPEGGALLLLVAGLVLLGLGSLLGLLLGLALLGGLSGLLLLDGLGLLGVGVGVARISLLGVVRLERMLANVYR